MKSNFENVNYTADMSDDVLFKKDESNYIYELGKEQLTTVGHTTLLDIYLMKGNNIEFHYHPNATEVVYCVNGEVEAGFLHSSAWHQFMLKPGEVLSIPQGYWHYVGASIDDTHILSVFDTDKLENVFGSDIFNLTPKELMADIYCLDEDVLKHEFSQIEETVMIGPSRDCMNETNTWNEMDDTTERQHPQPMARSGMEETNRTSPALTRNVVPSQQATAQDGINEDVQDEGAKRHQSPIRYGGTIVKEMNVCELCLHEISR